MLYIIPTKCCSFCITIYISIVAKHKNITYCEIDLCLQEAKVSWLNMYKTYFSCYIDCRIHFKNVLLELSEWTSIWKKCKISCFDETKQLPNKEICT